VEAGKAVTGSPAHDYTSALRSQAISRKLPELEKRIKELEALVKAINKRKSFDKLECTKARLRLISNFPSQTVSLPA
jgi:hypothetical protein